MKKNLKEEFYILNGMEKFNIKTVSEESIRQVLGLQGISSDNLDYPGIIADLKKVLPEPTNPDYSLDKAFRALLTEEETTLFNKKNIFEAVSVLESFAEKNNILYRIIETKLSSNLSEFGFSVWKDPNLQPLNKILSLFSLEVHRESSKGRGKDKEKALWELISTGENLDRADVVKILKKLVPPAKRKRGGKSNKEGQKKDQKEKTTPVVEEKKNLPLPTEEEWKKYLIISTLGYQSGAPKSFKSISSSIREFRKIDLSEKEVEDLLMSLRSEGVKIIDSKYASISQESLNKLSLKYSPLRFVENILVKMSLNLELSRNMFPNLSFRIEDKFEDGSYFYSISTDRSLKSILSMKNLLFFLKELGGKMYSKNSWIVNYSERLLSLEMSEEFKRNHFLLTLEKNL